MWVEVDNHTTGLFPIATWHRLLTESGFEVHRVDYPVSKDGRPMYLWVGRLVVSSSGRDREVGWGYCAGRGVDREISQAIDPRLLVQISNCQWWTAGGLRNSGPRTPSSWPNYTSGSNTSSGTTTSQSSQRRRSLYSGSDRSLSHVTMAMTVADLQRMPSGASKLPASCPTIVPLRFRSSKRFEPIRTCNGSPELSPAIARWTGSPAGLYPEKLRKTSRRLSRR